MHDPDDSRRPAQEAGKDAAAAPSGPARRRPVWQHPALLSLGFTALVLVLAFVPAVLQTLSGRGPSTAPRSAPGSEALGTSPTADAPWQARVDAQGRLRVLGLQLPGSLLADAHALWGDELQLALMMSRDGKVALEASVERAQPGGVSGRLVLGTRVDASTLSALREAAGTEKPVSADTWQLPLEGPSRQKALQAAVESIAFIPAAQLDAEVLRQRFGEPQARLQLAGETVEHWLYPAQGLAVALDAKGRELLQWVGPGPFDERLRAPLLQAGAVPVAAR